MSEETIELDLEYVNQTDEAYLVKDADDKKHWLPKSVVEVEDAINMDLDKGEGYMFLMPGWLAWKEGLI